MIRICLVFLLLSSSCFALELKRVILSSDENPYYLDFWPLVAPIWEKMGLKPTLALIADEDCVVDTTLGDVIRFNPLPDIPVSLQAQAIRLILPILFPDEGCLISDIDMIPISEDYFYEGALYCPDSSFLVYRDGAEGYHGMRYPMCYVAAKGQVFAEVFQVFDPSQFPETLRAWEKIGHGWNTDELVLFATLMQWERAGGHVKRLGHKVFGRLDRGNWNIQFESLDLNRYVDCHCPRPYTDYRDSIDEVVRRVLLRLVPSDQ